MEHADAEVKAIENLVSEKSTAAHQLLSDMVLSMAGGGVGDVTLG